MCPALYNERFCAKQPCSDVFPVQLLYDHFSGEATGLVWQHFAHVEGARLADKYLIRSTHMFVKVLTILK